MKVSCIVLGNSGLKLARQLKRGLRDQVNIHFAKDGIKNTIAGIFSKYDGHIFIMAIGIVVRAIKDLAKDKHKDPAVVVVDEGAHYAVSLLSGHEGGANELAARAASVLNADAVITTKSDAIKKAVVGIGFRRNEKKANLKYAIFSALRRSRLTLKDIRCVATVDLKRGYSPLLDAASELGVSVKFYEPRKLKLLDGKYKKSDFVESKIGVGGVCEPAVLLSGRNVKLRLPKMIIKGVAVAVGMEGSL